MGNDDVILKLECAELDESRLHALARDLARGLRNEGLSAATRGRDDAGPGQKGVGIIVGGIVLALVQPGGVAVKLLDVLQTFLARKATLRYELTRVDGRKISLDASWFSKVQLESTRKLLADFVKD